MKKVGLLPPFNATFELPGSKSESNRALVLKALFPNIQVVGLSAAHDTHILQKALEIPAGIVDVGPAGTAMRFATAFFANQSGTYILRGTPRMHQRPIGPLVTALQELGAQITYLEQHGFPPLQIKGQPLQGGTVEVTADLSSQFATALLLLAPALPGGLTVNLTGQQVSASYVQLTLHLLQSLGFEAHQHEQNIVVLPAQPAHTGQIVVQRDWSAAVFAYALVALKPGSSLWLPNLTYPSAQPDAKVVAVFEALGVRTAVLPEGIRITHTGARAGSLAINCENFPDMAQGLAVAMAGLGMAGTLSGLGTLRIKETDRIAAMATELARFGVLATVGPNSIALPGTPIQPPNGPVKTYDDHRMAMAFACLSTLFPIEISHPEVVSKSFPAFWDFFETLG